MTQKTFMHTRRFLMLLALASSLLLVFFLDTQFQTARELQHPRPLPQTRDASEQAGLEQYSAVNDSLYSEV